MKAQGPGVRLPTRTPVSPPKLSSWDSRCEDPNLPPAFRAAFKAHKKRGVDEFESMASVHTASSATRRTENDTDSDEDDNDSDFDGNDSFASVGEENDDDDDEAYREGRNQMARLVIETTRRSPSRAIRGGLRKPGCTIGGTPLDFIAE